VGFLIRKACDFLIIFVTPAKPSVPCRSGVFQVVEPLIELLPCDRPLALADVVTKNIVAGTRGAGIELEQLDRDRIEAVRGDSVVWKWLRRDGPDVPGCIGRIHPGGR